MKTLKIKVYGRVQGVCLRANTKTYCNKRGLCGSVSNNEDGSVVIIVQGGDEELKKFVEWIKNSPGFSKVDKVDSKEIKSGKFENFEIEKKENFFSDQRKAIGNLMKKI